MHAKSKHMHRTSPRNLTLLTSRLGHLQVLDALDEHSMFQLKTITHGTPRNRNTHCDFTADFPLPLLSDGGPHYRRVFLGGAKSWGQIVRVQTCQWGDSSHCETKLQLWDIHSAGAQLQLFFRVTRSRAQILFGSGCDGYVPPILFAEPACCHIRSACRDVGT